MIPKTDGRNHLLDGLRGWAALMVALGHSFITIKNTSFIDEVIYSLVNGGVAVSIFFLLSGFVLGESLKKDKNASNFLKTIKFYIKRLFRIYPIFILQIMLLSFFLIYWPYRNFSAGSSWYQYWFHFPLTVKEVLSNLFFRSTSLGGVTWTLKAEIIGSLFIPVFYLLSARTNKICDIGIVAGLIAGSYLLHVSREVSFLYVFYTGLMLPKWKNYFEKFGTRDLQLTAVSVLLFFGALGIAATPLDKAMPFVRHIPLVLLLGLLIYRPSKIISLFLSSRPLQFLGKISYSFYLSHFLVLYAVMRFVFASFDNRMLSQNFLMLECMIALLTISLAAGVSYYLYRYIEVPGIALGRKIAHTL
jgi:peptidoglycan/LPS O-acetylase OafA/YrhL